VVLPDRSGRATVLAGWSAVVVNVPGAASANIAVASIDVKPTGRWVSSVVCGTNRVTIRLNGAVSSATRVSWIVLG
jgi:hypothetical protein